MLTWQQLGGLVAMASLLASLLPPYPATPSALQLDSIEGASTLGWCHAMVAAVTVVVVVVAAVAAAAAAVVVVVVGVVVVVVVSPTRTDEGEREHHGMLLAVERRYWFVGPGNDVMPLSWLDYGYVGCVAVRVLGKDSERRSPSSVAAVARRVLAFQSTTVRLEVLLRRHEGWLGILLVAAPGQRPHFVCCCRSSSVADNMLVVCVRGVVWCSHHCTPPPGHST